MSTEFPNGLDSKRIGLKTNSQGIRSDLAFPSSLEREPWTEMDPEITGDLVDSFQIGHEASPFQDQRPCKLRARGVAP
jgi:hypothetical protein